MRAVAKETIVRTSKTKRYEIRLIEINTGRYFVAHKSKLSPTLTISEPIKDLNDAICVYEKQLLSLEGH